MLQKLIVLRIVALIVNMTDTNTNSESKSDTMSIRSNIQALKEKPETARVGVKWTNEENAELMRQAQEGMPFSEIATLHQRTVGGVKSHIMLNALRLMNEQDMSLEDAAKLVHISVEDLALFKQRKEKKDLYRKEQKKSTIAKKQPIVTSNNDINHEQIIGLLTEIRDYLKFLTEK